MKNLFSIILFLAMQPFSVAQETVYNTIENISYYPENVSKADNYIASRCVLDIYYPNDLNNFPTIVWFHGGGLTGGEKFIPDALKNKGVAVVAVNYRLYPKIKSPKYIEDAASAVAWTFNNIEKYGGDKSKIFVSGHSAGGYLASMIGLDKRWLNAYNIDSNNIAGLIPFSGHTITHFTVREEREIPGTQAVVDDLAPLFHIRKDAPPFLLITGDRDLELLGRYEENAYLWRMMNIIGHEQTNLYELDGYDHGGMAEPAFPLLLKEVNRVLQFRK